MQLILDTPTHKIEIPDGATVTTVNRLISTKDFYRRLTQSERVQLRTSMQDDVADLRDDLTREVMVDLSDPETIRLITDSGIFVGNRLNEVLRV